MGSRADPTFLRGLGAECYRNSLMFNTSETRAAPTPTRLRPDTKRCFVADDSRDSW